MIYSVTLIHYHTTTTKDKLTYIEMVQEIQDLVGAYRGQRHTIRIQAYPEGMDR